LAYQVFQTETTEMFQVSVHGTYFRRCSSGHYCILLLSV
jgi:hypothetical protein